MKRLSPLAQTATYALALFASKGIAFFMLPVFTHHLRPADYGTLEVLVTLADVGGVLMGLGLVDTLFRYAAAARDEARRVQAAADLMGLSVCAGLLLMGGAQLCAPLIARWLPGEVTTLQVRLLLVSLVLTASIQVPLAWLRMQDRALTYLVAFLGRAVLQSLLVLAALREGLGVTGVVAAGAFVDVLLCVLLLACSRGTGLRLPRAGLRAYLSYGTPLIVSGMAMFVLGSFDRWLLAAQVGSAQMGLYALAAKFGLVTALLLKPYEMWWYPRRLRVLAAAGGAERSAIAVARGIAAALLVASAVAQAGPPLLRWMSDASYHDAAVWIPWLALIAALHAISNLLTVGCYAGASTRVAMWINLSAAAFALPCYLLLIPPFGVRGAIAATLAAHLLRLLTFYRLSQQRLPLPLPALRLLLLGGVGSALTLAPAAAPSWSLPLAAAAPALTMLAAIVLLPQVFPSRLRRT